jgi:Fe2+ transport system protein B
MMGMAMLSSSDVASVRALMVARWSSNHRDRSLKDTSLSPLLSCCAANSVWAVVVAEAAEDPAAVYSSGFLAGIGLARRLQ